MPTANDDFRTKFLQFSNKNLMIGNTKRAIDRDPSTALSYTKEIEICENEQQCFSFTTKQYKI